MPIANTAVLLDLCSDGLILAEQMLETGRGSVARVVTVAGELKSALLETHQLATHGLAWQATYIEALRQGLLWAKQQGTGAFTAVEQAILHLGSAEYLQQMAGGIPISQREMIRPGDLGVKASVVQVFLAHPVLAALSDQRS